MTSILFTLTLAVLAQSPAEDSKPKDQAGAGTERTFHGDQVSVSGVGIEDLDVTSLAESLGAFFNTLGDQYGLETPYMSVQIEIGNPRNHALVTPDGKMFLRYAKKNSLAPMTLGNFPLARAMTRSVVRWHLLRTISTPFGLPEGMAEGFAAYIAEDALMQTTGKYDLPADKLPPAAAKYRKLLGDLDAAVGRPTLSFALVAMANAHAAGYQLLGVFRDSLASAVGEDAIKDIFPASLVNSPLGYAIASKGEPLASSPIYMVSSRRVLHDIPLIEMAGSSSSSLDRSEMFDNIWLYVKERYADPSLKAVDWQGAYDTLRPLVSYCREDVDFFLLVRQLLAVLRDPNTRLWSPEAAPMFESVRGLQADLIEKQVVISSVIAGSEAEKAGVKRGMIVTKVDGEEARPRLEAIAEYERLYDGLPAERHRYNRAANQILAGAPHTKAVITLMDENQKSIEVTLAREPIELSSAAKSPLESEVLPDRVGYVRIHRFVDGLGAAFGAAIDAMGDVGALVIDVRDSQSGLQGARVAAECISKLVKAPTIAGNWQMRNQDSVSPMPQRLIPAEKPFNGPVILVTDEWCFGTSEAFAVMLKTLGRARIVGMQTAGAQIEPREMAVPLGQAHILVSTVMFVPAVPLLVEGYGVPPDVAVVKTIADVRAGVDTIRARALEVAKESVKGSK